MEVLGFIKVAVTLTHIVLCPSPPDAGLVDYDFDTDTCMIHLEDGINYRKPVLYTNVEFMGDE